MKQGTLDFFGRGAAKKTAAAPPPVAEPPAAEEEPTKKREREEQPDSAREEVATVKKAAAVVSSEDSKREDKEVKLQKKADKPVAVTTAVKKREREAPATLDDEGDVELFDEDRASPTPVRNDGGNESDDENMSLLGDDDDDDLEDDNDVVHRPGGAESGKADAAKGKGSPKKASVSLFGGPAESYHPVKDACWKHGQPVPYKALADTFALIEQTSSRLHIIQHLCNLYRSIICLSPNDLLMAVYLSTNRLGPAYEGMELGIGEMIIMKAIGETCGKTLQVLKQQFKDSGDLGTLAMESRQTQKTLFQPATLTLQSVFKSFRAIATMKGNRSGDEKRNMIKKLLVAGKGNEARFIVRSLQGKLRIGLAEKSVLVALSYAIVLTPPDANFPPRIANRLKEGNIRGNDLKTLLDASVATIKEVYSEVPSYEAMLPVLLDTTIEYGQTVTQLRERCSIQPGVPVHPMLAQPTRGITEVLDRFAETGFTCEYKYDGERAQIHMTEPGKFRIFSRNLEDNTGKYPDIIHNLPHALVDAAGTTSFILDCEAVAWDKATQHRRPFQVLSTRRKKNVELGQVEVCVILYGFDLLYLNGQSLLKHTLQDRRELLRKTFHPVADEFSFAQYRDCTTVEEVREFLEKSVAEDCEGLMVKTLTYNATYEPSRRSYNWLKIKKDYLAGMTDSFDLVPIGAWYGKGKRTGTFGGYLLACYNDEDEEFQSISMVGTGFSDEQLKTFTEQLTPTITANRPHYVRVGEGKQAKPDVWLEPTVVWEIKAADLSISPVHTAAAGLVHESKGIALRFPRIIRVRDDKKPEQATSAEQVADMYRNQFSNRVEIGYGVENEQTRTLKQYKAETLLK